MSAPFNTLLGDELIKNARSSDVASDFAREEAQQMIGRVDNRHDARNLEAPAQNLQEPTPNEQDIEMGGANSALIPLSPRQKATLKRREVRRRAAERRRANMMARDQLARPIRASTTSPPSLRLSTGSSGVSPAGPSKTSGILHRQSGASTIRKASNVRRHLPETPSKAEGWNTMSLSSKHTLRRKIQRRRQMESEARRKANEVAQTQDLGALKMRQLLDILQQLKQVKPEERKSRLGNVFWGPDMIAHPLRASGTIVDPNYYRTGWLSNMISFEPQQLETLIAKGQEWKTLEQKDRAYSGSIDATDTARAAIKDMKLAETGQAVWASNVWKTGIMNADKLRRENREAMEALRKEMLVMVEGSSEKEFQWLDPTTETPSYATLANFNTPSFNQMRFKSLENDSGLVFKSESNTAQNSFWPFNTGGGGESRKATASREEEMEIDNVRRRIEQIKMDCELTED